MFLKITVSSRPRGKKTGTMNFVKNLSKKSDDRSADEWTVKHYLWFRGFFLKVQLRGSSQTSTAAPAWLPRRCFKWQSHADVRRGGFATKPRQKNKNDIIRQDERMHWFIGADEPKCLCCCFFCVFGVPDIIPHNPDEGLCGALQRHSGWVINNRNF